MLHLPQHHSPTTCIHVHSFHYDPPKFCVYYSPGLERHSPHPIICSIALYLYFMYPHVLRYLHHRFASFHVICQPCSLHLSNHLAIVLRRDCSQYWLIRLTLCPNGSRPSRMSWTWHRRSLSDKYYLTGSAILPLVQPGGNRRRRDDDQRIFAGASLDRRPSSPLSRIRRLRVFGPCYKCGRVRGPSRPSLVSPTFVLRYRRVLCVCYGGRASTCSRPALCQMSVYAFRQKSSEGAERPAISSN